MLSVMAVLEMNHLLLFSSPPNQNDNHYERSHNGDTENDENHKERKYR